jgi:hypothetical protein
MGTKEKLMPKKLRLILFKECPRNCEGCCNKDWDLDGLEVETDFSQYEEILLTGGEPLLKPELVFQVISQIKQVNPTALIYLYTAYLSKLSRVLHVLSVLNGITVTLHEEQDIPDFVKLLRCLFIAPQIKEGKSLRLNVFKGVDVSNLVLDDWQVKDSIEWIKDCPLPEGEVLRRYS